MYFVDYHKTQCLHICCYETGDEVSSRIFTSGDISASPRLHVLDESSLVGRGDPQRAGRKETSLTGPQDIGACLPGPRLAPGLWCVNIMHQLNWFTGGPAIQLNVTLGRSVREFPDEPGIWICGLSKADPPPNVGAHPISLGPEEDKMCSKVECALSAWQWELGHQASPVFGLALTPAAFPGLQLGGP